MAGELNLPGKLFLIHIILLPWNMDIPLGQQPHGILPYLGTNKSPHSMGACAILTMLVGFIVNNIICNSCQVPKMVPHQCFQYSIIEIKV